MNNKKIVAGLLALSFVFGGAVVPNAVVSNSVVTVASADGGSRDEYVNENTRIRYYPDGEGAYKPFYVYLELKDGTIEIANYYKYAMVANDEKNPVDVVLQGEIDGKTVSAIGSNVFNHTDNISKVTIPEGVTKIRYDAFAYDRYLKCAELPNSITSMGIGVFKGSGLEDIPKNISIISKELFEYCDNLKNVSIPNGVETIGESAFEECKELTSVTISDSVKTINKRAFYNSKKLTSVIIPDGVKEIADDAFFYNNGHYADGRWVDEMKPIENLTIYCYSGSYAETYAKINKLKYQILDKSERVSQDLGFTYKLNNNTVEISKYIGSDKEVKIPSKIDGVAVTSIGKGAFAGKNIEKIELPDSVTSIGESAFVSCSKLAEINLPYGVTSIGDSAFNGCTSLKDIVLPDSVTELGKSAFLFDSNLENVTLSKNLSTIKAQTFLNCTSLKDVVIPDSIENIEDSAFLGCKSLESINLPDSVKNIGSNTFVYCENLTDVRFPAMVDSIGNSVFAVCTSLKSIKLPESVGTVGNSLFGGCSALEEVILPSNMTSIDKQFFGSCVNLRSITIPASVTEIAEDAFDKVPFENLTIYCYTNSVAQQYAIDNDINHERLDAPKPFVPTYPTNIKVDYSEQYHQIRFTWDKVENADRYGIAVYLAGKWRIQAQNITGTSYTTPKNLTPGKTYKVAIAARVNGQWDATNAIKKAVTVTVK